MNLYSKFYLQKKGNIPTIVGIIIIFIVTFIFGNFFVNNLSKKSKASFANLRRVEVTNLTSNQASIYWLSDTKATGWVVYGERPEELNQTANDDRDLGSDKGIYINHHATLKDLKSSTLYYFRVISNNKTSGKPDGSPFIFKTLPESKNVSNLKPAFGKVIDEKGTALSNAVVVLSLKDSYPLSTFTKNNGEWLIPMNNIRNSKSNELKTPAENEGIKIDIIGENERISTITTNILQVNPVPETIILGKNYTFIDTGKVLGGTSNNLNTSGEIGIIFPKDNAIIPASNPLIKGLAVSNSEVNILIKGPKTSFSSKVKADKEGSWKLDLRSNLEAGNYTVTATTKDRSGKEISQTRRFVIAKSGESVLGEATPEATPTTLSPTPTIQPTSITTPTPPATGNNIIPIALSSISLIILGIGLILAF